MSAPMPISKVDSFYSSTGLLNDPPAHRSRSQEIKSLTDTDTDEMFGQQFTSRISSITGFDSDDDLFALDEPLEYDEDKECDEDAVILERRILEQLEAQEKRLKAFSSSLNAEFQEHRLHGLHRSERISEEALCEAIRFMKLEQEQSNQKEEGQ